jgi:WD40 repeat protein
VHGPVTAVAFAPRGPVVATRPTLSLAVSVDTKRVARGRSDGSVSIQGAGQPREILRRRGPGVTALTFSPDDTLLVTGDDNGIVRFWNLDTGRIVRVFSAHTAAIRSVAFSPDGKLLLTASADHEARIWNAVTAALDHILRWHFGPLAGAAFSPDGQWVVTAGPSAAGVGSVSTGRRLLLLRGHTEPLVGAGFAGRNGHTLVTAGKDGTLRAYRCVICGGIQELLRVAQRRLRKN